MLTRSGWIMAVLAAVLLTSGLVANYPELFAIGVTCLLALVVAAVWMLARPQMEISREIHPARVYEGEECLGVLRLSNRSSRRSPPIVALERVGNQRVLVPVPSIGPGADHTIAYALPTGRRGVFTIGPLTIGHADPLRLMQIARSYKSRTHLWVHPAVLAVPPMPAGRSRDLDGPTTDNAPQGGVAFHSLREYVPGDDRRLIHWRSSARTGRLMVRHHVIPNEPRLLVMLDTSADPYTGGIFEDAVRIAASMARSAWLNHQPVELRTTSGVVTMAEPRGAQFRDVLDSLAEVRPDDSDPGLRMLLGIGLREDGLSLAVVTGRPRAEQLWVLRQVRAAFQGITLICVTGEAGHVAVGVPGVLTVTVPGSRELADALREAARR